MPTLKQALERKPKNRDEAQNITDDSKATGVYRNCRHLSSQEKKTKPVNANPKENGNTFAKAKLDLPNQQQTIIQPLT